MLLPGRRSALAHFQRFGPLAYRLAFAMLGDPVETERAVAEVFGRYAAGDSLWPDWRSAVEAVHARCLEIRRSRSPDSPRPATKPAPTAARNDERIPLPAETVKDVFAALPEVDRTLLWDALLGDLEEADREALADSLRRLDIGLRNEAIPGGGDTPWPT